MNLHKHNDIFTAAIQASSKYHKLPNIFIEKDYWITASLYRISQSRFADLIVFKGGTSLSKGYDCIKRFSEDVDLAVITKKNQPGNQIKKMLKQITDTASSDLQEESEGSSKGSMIRKIYYSYPQQFELASPAGPVSNKILLEVHAFAHPSPFKTLPLSTYIHDFLKQRGSEDLITQFGLHPFPFQVLCIERTFTEKIMALVKASCNENPLQALGQKIRHIYDIHQLMQRADIQLFINSSYFYNLLEIVKKSDQEAPTGDCRWQDVNIAEFPIFADTKATLTSLRTAYRQGLGSIIYGFLPDEHEIIPSFQNVAKRLRGEPQ